MPWTPGWKGVQGIGLLKRSEKRVEESLGQRVEESPEHRIEESPWHLVQEDPWHREETSLAKGFRGVHLKIFCKDLQYKPSGR